MNVPATTFAQDAQHLAALEETVRKAKNVAVALAAVLDEVEALWDAILTLEGGE